MIEHPQIIHFPIALLLSAVLSELISYIAGQEFWEKVTLYLLSLGVITALVAVLTGNAAADKIGSAAAVTALVVRHREMGLWVLFFFGAVWIIKWIFFHYKITSLPYRLTITLLMLIGSLLIYQAGHFGGNLVYKHGIGIHIIK